MSEAQKYLQQLDANPNHELLEAYNKHFAETNLKYRLIMKENVRPCFFSGNIEEPGKVIAISLNPADQPGKTEAAQEGKDFARWYNFCLYRFDHYESDSQVHSVFKNLLKVIAPLEKWETIGKRKYGELRLVILLF